MLKLPSGTLTQRTLVWRFEFIPEGPKSTWGNISNFLTGQACSHSRHQARIRLQGHHNWENRFHRITGQLPGGLSASEVCAESWPVKGWSRRLSNVSDAGNFRPATGARSGNSTPSTATT